MQKPITTNPNATILMLSAPMRSAGIEITPPLCIEVVSLAVKKYFNIPSPNTESLITLLLISNQSYDTVRITVINTSFEPSGVCILAQF